MCKYKISNQFYNIINNNHKKKINLNSIVEQFEKIKMSEEDYENYYKSVDTKNNNKGFEFLDELANLKLIIR